MDRAQKYTKYFELQSQVMGRRDHNGVIPLNKALATEKDITFKIVSPVQQILDRVRSEVNKNMTTKEESVVCEGQKVTKRRRGKKKSLAKENTRLVQRNQLGVNGEYFEVMGPLHADFCKLGELLPNVAQN